MKLWSCTPNPVFTNSFIFS